VCAVRVGKLQDSFCIWRRETHLVSYLNSLVEAQLARSLWMQWNGLRLALVALPRVSLTFELRVVRYLFGYR